MNKILKIFLVVVGVFVLFNIVATYKRYTQLNNMQTMIALQNSKLLSNFLISFRDTYQKSILKNKIKVDEKTIHLLPVATMKEISELFSATVNNQTSIKTVSDRPRNPKNRADSLEMEAINFFKKHSNKKEYYKKIKRNSEEIFFYASPLYIKKECLACHGKKESTIKSVKKRYDNAYDYKIGDLRGIISIAISQKQIKKELASVFIRDTLLNLFLSVMLLVVIYILLKIFNKKEDEYTARLESEVKSKTKDLEAKKDELRYKLYNDELTNLPNRNKLLDAINEKNFSCLILLNIDSFNEINDFYGYETGDFILKEYSILLKNRLLSTDLDLYKMPSDEFAITCRKATGIEQLKEIIQYLISQTQKYIFNYKGQDINITVTVGATLKKQNILANADMALKKAKKERKNYIIHDESIDITKEYEENLRWAKIVKTAIENDKIVPYFQPIFSLKAGEIVKYEALARLIDENGNVIPPYAFLKIAKRTKLYPHITKTMIDKTFEYFKDKKFIFSINLSVIDIMDKDMVKFIEKKIENFREPYRINFEILESEGIKNYDEVLNFIKKIKSFGCIISVDDFGAGYSNFEHILKLNVDVLKIDASLIKNIDKNHNAQIIIKTIVDFANMLGIKTCAEFVSSPEIYEKTKELGIDYFQGYYIGKPSPTI